MNAEVNENDVLDIMYMVVDEDDMVTSIDQAADETANLLGLDPNWVHSLVVNEEEEMFPMSSELTEATAPMSKADLLRQFFTAFPPGAEGENYRHYQQWVEEHADGGPDQVASRPFYQKTKKALSDLGTSTPSSRKTQPQRRQATRTEPTPQPSEDIIDVLSDAVRKHLEEQLRRFNERNNENLTPADAAQMTGLKVYHIPPAEAPFGREEAGFILDLPRELRHPDEYPHLEDEPLPYRLQVYSLVDVAAGRAWQDVERMYKDDDSIEINFQGDLPWVAGRPVGRAFPVF